MRPRCGHSDAIWGECIAAMPVSTLSHRARKPCVTVVPTVQTPCSHGSVTLYHTFQHFFALFTSGATVVDAYTQGGVI